MIGGFRRLLDHRDSISDAGGNLSVHSQAEAFPEGRNGSCCAAGRNLVAIVGIVCIVGIRLVAPKCTVMHRPEP